MNFNNSYTNRDEIEKENSKHFFFFLGHSVCCVPLDDHLKNIFQNSERSLADAKGI